MIIETIMNWSNTPSYDRGEIIRTLNAYIVGKFGKDTTAKAMACLTTNKVYIVVPNTSNKDAVYEKLSSTIEDEVNFILKDYIK
jgi:hypothetical protein